MFGRFARLAETLVAKARLSWGQHLRQKSRDLSIESTVLWKYRDTCDLFGDMFSIPITYLDTIFIYQLI